MRCLVTGAAGFVGSTLCDYLLSQGFQVVGIDCFVDYYPRQVKEKNLVIALENPNFKLISEDLNNLDLGPIIDNIDLIFHQSAQAGVRASWGRSFETYVRHNVIATQKLLEAAKTSKQLRKIVYASSSSVYGNAEQFPTSENVVPKPVSPYGVTKLAAENLMQLYSSEFGVPTVSLRYFTVYGPRQRPEMAFHRFIRSGYLKEIIEVYGDGEQSRDFTYIDDIAQANILAAEKGTLGSIYNIGGGIITSVNQILKNLEKIIGPLDIHYLPAQKGDAKHTSADTTLAKLNLGYKPSIDISEGLTRQADWISGLLNL